MPDAPPPAPSAMSFDDAPRLVEIGGRPIAVQRRGAGPLVVMESGAGGPGIGLGWGGVDARIAQFASVVTYDRAGVGLSPRPDSYLRIGPAAAPAPPPTIADRAADLTALLEVVAPGERAGLVGWSLGGLIVQHYAALHPERTAGLLLIDPTPLDGFADLPAWQNWLIDTQLPARLMRRMAGWGWLRGRWVQDRLRGLLSAQVGPRFDRERLLPMVAGVLADPLLHEAVLLDSLRLRASLAQTAAVLKDHPLPDVPLIVLSAGYHGGSAAAAKAGARTAQAHARLAASLPHGVLRKLADVSHHVPFEAPEAIVDAVRELAGKPRFMSPEHVAIMNARVARAAEVQRRCAALGRSYIVAYVLTDAPLGASAHWRVEAGPGSGVRFALGPATADVTIHCDYRAMLAATQDARAGRPASPPGARTEGDAEALRAVAEILALARAAATVDVDFPE
jgi:pimeloyl-ACP methyl ester carboxylesterase